MACESKADEWTRGSLDHQKSSYFVETGANKKQHVVRPTPLLGSCRLVVMICCFMSVLTNFSGQTIMTSAMVCMLVSPTEQNDVINVTTNATSASHENAWMFTWDPKTQNLILSSYFMTYFLGQLPSGIVSQRFSNRKTLILGQTISGLLQVLTVPATQWGVPGLVVVRLIGGLSSSVLYASSLAILANWTPRHETSVIFGCVGIGMEAGNLLAFLFSMFACRIDTMGGWPFVFFCQGALQLIVVSLFVFCVYETPSSHPSIRPEEREYLLSSAMQKKTWTNTPVRAIVTSLPVMALVVSKAGGLCGYFLFVVVIPQFARDILKLPTLYVSLVNSLPYLVIFPSVALMGKLSDYIVLKGISSNTTVRKSLDFINKIVYAILVIILGYFPEGSWPLTFVMNVAIIFVLGTGYLTYEANPADLSPAHTGFISAYVQAICYWITFVTSLFVGFVTEERTRESWQLAFYVVAGVQVLTFVIYTLFGSGEMQPWALQEESLCPGDEVETTVGSGGEKNILEINEGKLHPKIARSKIYGTIDK